MNKVIYQIHFIKDGNVESQNKFKEKRQVNVFLIV